MCGIDANANNDNDNDDDDYCGGAADDLQLIL